MSTCRSNRSAKQIPDLLAPSDQVHGTVATCDGGATGLSCAPGVAARMAASLAWEDRDEDTRTGQRDFFNTNPDGTPIGRAAFIAQIARGSTVRNIREHDGDTAVRRLRHSSRADDLSEFGRL